MLHYKNQTKIMKELGISKPVFKALVKEAGLYPSRPAGTSVSFYDTVALNEYLQCMEQNPNTNALIKAYNELPPNLKLDGIEELPIF